MTDDNHVPAGYYWDPYAPESYHAECPDCGSSEKTSDHPAQTGADRCPRCDRARGVTPISPESSDESDEQPTETTDESTAVTDGGMTDEKAAEYVDSVAHSAEPALSDGELYMLDQVAAHLRGNGGQENSDQGNGNQLFGDGGTESYSSISFTGGADDGA